MAPHSSTLAWKIPWTEEPGRLQSMGSLRVGLDWATSLSLSFTGEGNGNPLQCSSLENPRDGGAWWAAVYGVAQSRTLLKWLSSSSNEVWLSELLVYKEAFLGASQIRKEHSFSDTLQSWLCSNHPLQSEFQKSLYTYSLHQRRAFHVELSERILLSGLWRTVNIYGHSWSDRIGVRELVCTWKSVQNSSGG